jgi:hypothetical protein
LDDLSNALGMTKSPSLRDQIESAAERLGATRAAIFKWRSRGVPSEWRLKLLADPETNFTLEDFDQVVSKPADAVHLAASHPQEPAPRRPFRPEELREEGASEVASMEAAGDERAPVASEEVRAAE